MPIWYLNSRARALSRAVVLLLSESTRQCQYRVRSSGVRQGGVSSKAGSRSIRSSEAPPGRGRPEQVMQQPEEYRSGSPPRALDPQTY
jgi:hypothetical protein